MKKLFLPLFILFSALSIQATHIIGGYITYRYISGTSYEVKLIAYRDCSVGTAGFDNPAYVGIFNASTNTLVQSISFFSPVITRIPTPNDPCLQVTNIACVEEAVYTNIVTFPSATTPYYIAYQRCCRNGTITNVLNPGNAGETFFAYVPPTTPFQNSSPTYNNLPPIYVCVNLPLSYDHSATDINGDELRYSLCTPYDGASFANPQPTTPSPPPYTNINWRLPYSATNPMGGVPLTIDSLTGQLTGRPNAVGQFVVGVCVSEYRNGQLIGTYLRDFQFNVTTCNVPIASIPSASTDPVTGLGIFSSECKNFTINFRNNSFNPPPTNISLEYQWDFGVPGIDTDTSSLSAPTYTYTDTGIYKVRLVIKKGSGISSCTDTAYALVRIFPTLNVDFQLKDTCANVSTPFTDLSATSYGTITKWTWHFGDGTTSTQRNPTHTYSNSGTYNVMLIAETSVGCKDTMRKQINIYVTASAGFTFDTVCAGQPIQFNTSAGASNYNWNFGSGATSTLQNPTHTYTTPGNKTVSLVTIASNGCKDSVSYIVPVKPLPVITATSDTSICYNTPFQLSATGGTTYLWSPATGLSDPNIANPIATITSTTPVTYTVSVTDANQCSNQKSVTISVRPPVDAGDGASICSSTNTPGESAQLQATGAVTYQWSPAAGLSNTSIANPVANPIITTMYYVTGTDAFGCVSVDSVLVGVGFYPEITKSSDTTICAGESASLNVSGGDEYIWSPADSLSCINCANPFANPSATTTYYVTVTDAASGCSVSDSLVITVENLNINPNFLDTLINVGESVTLGVQLNGSGSSYLYFWTPGTYLNDSTASNPITTPLNDMMYQVMVSNGVCTDTTSMMVRINTEIAVEIPSAFTPNGDGRNDEFFPVFLNNSGTVLHLRIYNRYGQMIHNSANPWDGKFKGTEQPVGTYVYYMTLRMKNEEQKNYQGSFTLIR